MIPLAISVFRIGNQMLAQKIDTVYILEAYDPPQILGAYIQAAAAKGFGNHLLFPQLASRTSHLTGG